MSIWRKKDQQRGAVRDAARVAAGTPPPQDPHPSGRAEPARVMDSDRGDAPAEATRTPATDRVPETDRGPETARRTRGAQMPTTAGAGTVGGAPGSAPSGAYAETGGRRAADWAGEDAWQERSRLVVTPIAAPSILGLMGFAGATFMVASNLAGWWGNAILTPLILAPFAATFGGLAQFLAGMWAYRARDGVATAMHGTWGAFWLAYGLLALAVATGMVPATVMSGRAFGFWFVVLCVVTFFGALAALRQNMALFTVLGLLAAGSGLLAAGLIGAISVLVTAAGWVLVASAAAAFYTAGALMLQNAWSGRVVLPLGEWSRSNVPSRKTSTPVQYPQGMPGARVGQ